MAANERHKGNAGFLSDDRIGTTPKKIDASIIERFRKLNDITGTISDYLDEKGIRGVVGASLLKPTIGDRTIVGRAVTVRNTPQPLDAYRSVSENDNLMSEVEAMHQAEPGDVLVIQGLSDVSNMGGIMATVASRQGIVGAVVDGGVRDVGHSRKLNFPIWSKDLTPITGKWRCATQEINGVVNIMGVSVTPGDLIVADETGVCFVPQDLILPVLELCEAADAKEANWVKHLDEGMSIPDLVQKLYQNFPHQKNQRQG
ncbi:RraA family protein [Rhizobium jaguaris]|uniref:RraA family protein n=1 Tax=Rhizobium jaguaris TaxID=1312183 RepID=UPI0039BFB615